MADYASFRRGGATFPLATGTSMSLLRRADPFVFYALEYYEQVLQTHLGAALLEKATGTSIPSVVADLCSINPLPYLESGMFKFPLLAVYRLRGISKDRTVGYRHDEDTFEVLYVLPPLSLGDAIAVGAAARAVTAILDDRTSVGFDPTHTPTGGALGGDVWELAGTESVSLTEHEYGFIDGLDRLPMYGVRMRGRVRDREGKVDSDFLDFDGADVDVSVRERNGSSLLTAQTATQRGPVIASLDLVAGPIAGGTLVTVTGARFKPPTLGLLASVPLEGLTIVSPTSLTFRTPAQLPSIVGTAVDLEIECDGQSVTKTAAFTYTA